MDETFSTIWPTEKTLKNSYISLRNDKIFAASFNCSLQEKKVSLSTNAPSWKGFQRPVRTSLSMKHKFLLLQALSDPFELSCNKTTQNVKMSGKKTVF